MSIKIGLGNIGKAIGNYVTEVAAPAVKKVWQTHEVTILLTGGALLAGLAFKDLCKGKGNPFVKTALAVTFFSVAAFRYFECTTDQDTGRITCNSKKIELDPFYDFLQNRARVL